ncbi:MAG: helix-turn-helix domain-containing protein [Thermoguttaceae bacterium]|jgi:excisionase family DNA binding protein
MNNQVVSQYDEYLKLTNDPAAAASLALADVMQRTLDASGGVAANRPVQTVDEPLTVAEVAQRLRVSRRVAYELCQAGQIEAFKVGRAIRVRPEDLAAYIERRTDRGPDALGTRRPNRARSPRRAQWFSGHSG